ncbi:nucleoside deaminase [bacterium]|nr:nucleoside deaminase [bacterium]
MKKAIFAAKTGFKKGQSPFGAVIVKNGKIIVATHNHVWKNGDATAHAEVTAIRLACKKLKTIDLSDCIIYSTTEPCPMCFAAIHWARIGTIVYGATIADAARAGFNELSVSNRTLNKLGKAKMKIKSGVLRKEAVELFKVWTRSAFYQPY